MTRKHRGVLPADNCVLTDDNQMLPIVSWFRDGDRTDDPSEATHCVAGPDADGCYELIKIGAAVAHRVH